MTLLRSVAAVPGAVEAVSCDLKLARDSSPLSQGAPVPMAPAGADCELSARLYNPNGGRTGIEVGLVDRLLARASSLMGCGGEATVEVDLKDETEGPRDLCQGGVCGIAAAISCANSGEITLEGVDLRGS